MGTANPLLFNNKNKFTLSYSYTKTFSLPCFCIQTMLALSVYSGFSSSFGLSAILLVSFLIAPFILKVA